jgi:hypothetical protein
MRDPQNGHLIKLFNKYAISLLWIIKNYCKIFILVCGFLVTVMNNLIISKRLLKKQLQFSQIPNIDFRFYVPSLFLLFQFLLDFLHKHDITYKVIKNSINTVICIIRIT